MNRVRPLDKALSLKRISEPRSDRVYMAIQVVIRDEVALNAGGYPGQGAIKERV